MNQITNIVMNGSILLPPKIISVFENANPNQQRLIGSIEQLVTGIARFFDQAIVSLMLWDEGTERLVLRAQHGWATGSEWLHRASFENGQNGYGALWRCAPRWIPDFGGFLDSTTGQPKFKYKTEMFGDENQKAVLVLPLSQFNNPFGLLTIHLDDSRDLVDTGGIPVSVFSKIVSSEVAALASYFNKQQVALENRRQQTVLKRLLQERGENKSREEMAQQACDSIITVCPIRSCAIWDIDEETFELSGDKPLATSNNLRAIDQDFEKTPELNSAVFRVRHQNNSHQISQNGNLTEVLQVTRSLVPLIPQGLHLPIGLLEIRWTDLARHIERGDLPFHDRKFLDLMAENIANQRVEQRRREQYLESQRMWRGYFQMMKHRHHRIRNRMASIDNMAEQIRLVVTPSTVSSASLIAKITREMSETIGELRHLASTPGDEEISKIGQIESDVDVSEIATRLIDQFQDKLLEKRINCIHESIQPGIISSIDRGRVTESFESILENAVHELATNIPDPAKREMIVELRTGPDPFSFSFTVTDTGNGMSVETLSKTQNGEQIPIRDANGQGIGLKKTREFVTVECDGKFNVSSAEGAGTRVSLYFLKTEIQD